MRKLDDNAVYRFQITAMEKLSQPLQKLQLVSGQAPAVQVKPLGYSDTTMTAAHRFNRVGAGQLPNIPPNGFDTHTEFMCQILAGVMPSQAQNLQQFLTALPWVQIHLQNSFRCSSIMFGLLVLAVTGKLFSGLFQTLHLAGRWPYVDGGDFLIPRRL